VLLHEHYALLGYHVLHNIIPVKCHYQNQKLPLSMSVTQAINSQHKCNSVHMSRSTRKYHRNSTSWAMCYSQCIQRPWASDLYSITYW